MSPLNRGPSLGPRGSLAGVWPPPPPRFGGRLPPPSMPPRMPPPPMSGVFGPMRQRLPPPPRPGGVSRLGGPLPLFAPRCRGIAPLVPPMGIRGTGPRGPHTPGWPRRIAPQFLPQFLPHIRARFAGNGGIKGKLMSATKKVNKLEELELKKPWMTDEIRSEIQKKNKLYAKAKKNKDAKEWEEFKDLRNKVTRMIRDAKNEYLAKHPEQGGQKTDDKSTIESEGVQKTENAPEKSEQSEQKEQSEQSEQSEQMEQTEETQPSSEQAHLYVDDEEPCDQTDEGLVSSEEEETFYCEVCDRDFHTEENLSRHKETHKLCGIDGCTFLAHPLLVERHISMQHSSGLYSRMKNLSTPEDIQNWIAERKKLYTETSKSRMKNLWMAEDIQNWVAERKKRYPTKANIEMQKAAESEKQQRGEIIKQKTSVAKSRPSRAQNSRDRKRKPRKRPAHVVNDTPVCTLYRGMKPFAGTLSLVEEELEVEQLESANDKENSCKDEIDSISDEDEPTHLASEFETALPTLVANYGTDSNDEEAPDEVPIKKMKTTDENLVDRTSPIRTEERSSADVLKSDKPNNAPPENRRKQRTDANRREKKNVARDTFKKKRPYGRLDLLERLLARSIQHERNLICQCVKYIVDNNYFQ